MCNPPGPGPPRPPVDPKRPSDFDAFFDSPFASNQSSVEARLHDKKAVYTERPLAQEPGQFTRLFGRDEIAAASAAPAESSPGSAPAASGSNTLFPPLPMEKVSGSAPAAASAAEPEAAGSSDFSRVFQRPTLTPPKDSAAAQPSAVEAVKSAKDKMSKTKKTIMSLIAAILVLAVAAFLFYKKHH